MSAASIHGRYGRHRVGDEMNIDSDSNGQPLAYPISGLVNRHW